MTKLANRYDNNIAGRYFVDDYCIDCDLCRHAAPINFARSDDTGYSYVYKQPENDKEEAMCKEAMENCPADAIGDFGENG